MSDEAGPPASVDDERTKLLLDRYFFVLPEPVSLPDGFQHASVVGNDPTTAEDDDPFVSLIFHQVDVPGGRSQAGTVALMRAVDNSGALPDRRTTEGEEEQSWKRLLSWRPWRRVPAFGAQTQQTSQVAQFTVVEAVTSAESPDTIPEEDAGDPVRWLPRADAFTRCVALTDRVLRAHRQATESLYGPLTYVRIPSPVVVLAADGVEEKVWVKDQPFFVVRPLGEWRFSALMMLQHLSLLDPFRYGEFTPDVQERFGYWLNETARGNPLGLWRERIIEARRAYFVTGELAQAVLLANTSAEVMLDTILALLTWEDGACATDVTGIFEEGKTLRRVTTEFPSRLKGNWSTSQGPVGEWFTNAYRVRHRVIHAGYTPTPAEAQAAIDAAFNLQRFLMDRIAAQRNRYPRSALILLGQSGLEKRSLWAGKIRAFAAGDALREPDWRDSFTNYYRDLVEALTPPDIGSSSNPVK